LSWLAEAIAHISIVIGGVALSCVMFASDAWSQSGAATAICSPTRAALLSGRNHHRAGFGITADDSGGFPGYNSIWKKSTVCFPEVLRRNGYSTSIERQLILAVVAPQKSIV
jgi:hypothetical protein